MKVTSPAFENNKPLPVKYTAQGDGVNPPLNIEKIPEGAKSLALIVDDPDAPMGTFVHWVVYDIPPASFIAENSIPGRQGVNTIRGRGYVSPNPPFGTHRYVFRVYALDKTLGLEENRATKESLEKAMEGHILNKAELVGLYKKH